MDTRMMMLWNKRSMICPKTSILASEVELIIPSVVNNIMIILSMIIDCNEHCKDQLKVSHNSILNCPGMS